MPVDTQAILRIRPAHLGDETRLRRQLRQALGLSAGAPLPPHRIVRRSIDARRGPPVYELRVALGAAAVAAQPLPALRPPPPDAPTVVVVGAGPAGYFAALELLEHGIRPVVVERGPDVAGRRKPIAALHRGTGVDTEANYCFGEGGAGTFSDGKLYTRATKRGDVAKVLQRLVDHGADGDILIDAQAHIGSNRLPRIVRSLRETIVGAGGRVHFRQRAVDLVSRGGRVCGVLSADGETFCGRAVIMATGHSARDVYRLLARRGARLEPKPFALGVRLEHPQALIDAIQYRSAERPPGLPPAAYRLRAQVDGRGVFSFCMCPGGHVIPAMTAPGELVLNGMSMAGRGGPRANAGMVVELRLEDLAGDPHDDPFAALGFQRQVEARAWAAAGAGSLRAPAQRMTDFVAARPSASLPQSSYTPGLVPWPVHELLPAPITRRLQAAMRRFDRQMRGFLTAEALVLAVESRTSAPVRVRRDPDTLMAPDLPGLYPCGEGAGYAGGIVSAAVDGQNVARRLARALGRV